MSLACRAITASSIARCGGVAVQLDVHHGAPAPAPVPPPAAPPAPAAGAAAVVCAGGAAVVGPAAVIAVEAEVAAAVSVVGAALEVAAGGVVGCVVTPAAEAASRLSGEP